MSSWGREDLFAPPMGGRPASPPPPASQPGPWPRTGSKVGLATQEEKEEEHTRAGGFMCVERASDRRRLCSVHALLLGDKELNALASYIPSTCSQALLYRSPTFLNEAPHCRTVVPPLLIRAVRKCTTLRNIRTLGLSAVVRVAWPPAFANCVIGLVRTNERTNTNVFLSTCAFIRPSVRPFVRPRLRT